MSVSAYHFSFADIETDFIHASHVSGLPYKMICAQGPVEEAVDRFWMMIAQEGVGVIVQLCQNQEEGREKCADYVPTQPTTYGNVTVCVEERQKMVAAVPAIKKTTLRVTGGGNQSLEVSGTEIQFVVTMLTNLFFVLRWFTCCTTHGLIVMFH